jgi:hypothetical protein
MAGLEAVSDEVELLIAAGVAKVADQLSPEFDRAAVAAMRTESARMVPAQMNRRKTVKTAPALLNPWSGDLLTAPKMTLADLLPPPLLDARACSPTRGRSIRPSRRRHRRGRGRHTEGRHNVPANRPNMGQDFPKMGRFPGPGVLPSAPTSMEEHKCPNDLIQLEASARRLGPMLSVTMMTPSRSGSRGQHRASSRRASIEFAEDLPRRGVEAEGPGTVMASGLFLLPSRAAVSPEGRGLGYSLGLELLGHEVLRERPGHP